MSKYAEVEPGSLPVYTIDLPNLTAARWQVKAGAANHEETSKDPPRSTCHPPQIKYHVGVAGP